MRKKGPSLKILFYFFSKRNANHNFCLDKKHLTAPEVFESRLPASLPSFHTINLITDPVLHYEIVQIG